VSDDLPEDLLDSDFIDMKNLANAALVGKQTTVVS